MPRMWGLACRPLASGRCVSPPRARMDAQGGTPVGENKTRTRGSPSEAGAAKARPHGERPTPPESGRGRGSPPALPHHRTCGSASGGSRRVPETAVGVGESPQDSNLHPVALNLVTRVSYPSVSRQIVRIVLSRTMWTYRTIWILPETLPRASSGIRAARQPTHVCVAAPRSH